LYKHNCNMVIMCKSQGLYESVAWSVADLVPCIFSCLDQATAVQAGQQQAIYELFLAQLE